MKYVAVLCTGEVRIVEGDNISEAAEELDWKYRQTRRTGLVWRARKRKKCESAVLDAAAAAAGRGGGNTKMNEAGILSGLEIEKQVKAGNIFISDFDRSRLNPNSYNLRLHDELLVYIDDPLDMKKPNRYTTLKIPESGMQLIPGCIYLGRTMERTETDCFVPMLEGRSSVGRLGIFIHVTAGFGDVGFDGFWTLEISCIQPVIIYPGIDICQIYYHTIMGDYEKYGHRGTAKYQNNSGIQPSMMWRDFLRDSRCEEKTSELPKLNRSCLKDKLLRLLRKLYRK